MHLLLKTVANNCIHWTNSVLTEKNSENKMKVDVEYLEFMWSMRHFLITPIFEVSNTVEKDGFTEIKMTMASHTGTHIDAPCHIIQDTKSLDQFPVDKFVGKAIVIPCQDKEDITLEYLQTYEDRIAQVDFILFITGWQYKWKTKDYFSDSQIPTIEAAKWLTNFKFKGTSSIFFQIST